LTFKDYVISYQVGDKIVANLYDYYEVFIKNLDERFKQYSYYNQNLVLCYFKDHADVNPSMGWIKHKYLKGVKVCHCFGCGKTADVVRLHQILSKQYLDKELTENEACYEICNMFDIPTADFEEITDEDLEKHYIRNLNRIEKLKTHYTIREFSQSILNLREESTMGNVDLKKLNSECVKMIATVKQLYD
jgi:DNA primase